MPGLTLRKYVSMAYFWYLMLSTPLVLSCIHLLHNLVAKLHIKFLLKMN